MTEQELRGVPGFVEMCVSGPFLALLSHLEQNCPFVDAKLIDATALIRNEGSLQGWMQCAKRLRKIHLAPPPPPKKAEGPQRLYPDAPDQRKTHTK
jgi:hypothetical protein